MTIQVKSLADFKRFLALPGAVVKCVRHDYAAKSGKAEWLERCMKPRTVAKLQTNAVAFKIDGESDLHWLYFEKASDFDFDGGNVVIYRPKAADPESLVIFNLELVEG